MTPFVGQIFLQGNAAPFASLYHYWRRQNASAFASTSKLNSKTVSVLPSLTFTFGLLPSFSFCFLSGFLAIFIMLTSNNICTIIDDEKICTTCGKHASWHFVLTFYASFIVGLISRVEIFFPYHILKKNSEVHRISIQNEVVVAVVRWQQANNGNGVRE